MEETVQLLERTIDRRISVELHPYEGVWMVKADEAELQHVLMNLSINAKDTLMERIEGGCNHSSDLRDNPPTIAMKIENMVVDEDYVSRYPFAREGRFVAFSVSDNGCGMDKKTLDRIFDPFFTTKELGKGTGLGLAMVYGLVKQHRGWILTESDVGVGTTFTFYLPAAEDAEVSAKDTDCRISADHRALRASGSLTVLLADDEEIMRDVGKTMLEHLGYRVVLAEDGERAVELYKKERPDLVVLDLTMPKLSGDDVLRLILDYDPMGVVIISSGHPTSEFSERLIEMGARFYLQKPYRIREVKKAIEKAMGIDPIAH
jgi:CheY-like chemotaxis protein